jgi:hypothetical protein
VQVPAALPVSIAVWLPVLLSRPNGERAPLSAWCVRLRAALFVAPIVVRFCAMLVWLSSSSRFPAAPETCSLPFHR